MPWVACKLLLTSSGMPAAAEGSAEVAPWLWLKLDPTCSVAIEDKVTMKHCK